MAAGWLRWGGRATKGGRARVRGWAAYGLMDEMDEMDDGLP